MCCHLTTGEILDNIWRHRWSRTNPWRTYVYFRALQVATIGMVVAAAAVVVVAADVPSVAAVAVLFVVLAVVELTGAPMFELMTAGTAAATWFE